MNIKLEDVLSAIKGYDAVLYDAIIRAARERQNKEATCNICGSRMTWQSEDQYWYCPKCKI